MPSLSAPIDTHTPGKHACYRNYSFYKYSVFLLCCIHNKCVLCQPVHVSLIVLVITVRPCLVRRELKEIDED
jgi:hypothetical protein